MISRRSFVKGGATLFAGAAMNVGKAGVFAADSFSPLGFHNGPANGYDNEPMQRVFGRAPKDLTGVLYRNGPAHFRRGDQTLNHWFDGDGLVRAFRIAGGNANLSAQFVKTIKRRRDEEAGRFIMPGFGTPAAPGAPVTGPDDANAANTALLSVEDRLWALWEAGSPFDIDPNDLSTNGPVVLRDDLAQMPFSAHPKVSPDGMIWNFGLAYGHPFAFLWGLSSRGAVVRSGIINLPSASYMHDWAVTQTKLIFPLQPWVFTRQQPPFVRSLTWQPENGLKVLVVDKDDFDNRQIYELPAGAFFHTGNAFEEPDGTIRFDVCLAERPTLDAEEGSAILRGGTLNRATPHMTMAVLKPNGTAEFEHTSISAEFPRVDPRQEGLRHSRVYSVTEGALTTNMGYRFNTVMAMDWTTGTQDTFDFGLNVLVEEPIFAPHPNKTDHGWLLVPTLHLDKKATCLHVFDASNLYDGPVVSWQAAAPLPLSFHGVWSAA